MGGAFKSGLVFGVVGLLVVGGLTFLFPLCGPVGAALVGAVAGYFGVRWSAERASIGMGILAGTLAGGLMLIGTLILIIVLFSAPQYKQALQTALEQQQQQQQAAQLTPDQQQLITNMIGPIAGFCFGLINLIASLGFGALGGLVAMRNRGATTPPPQAPRPPSAPQPPRSSAPPMQPPPLAPMD